MSSKRKPTVIASPASTAGKHRTSSADNGKRSDGGRQKRSNDFGRHGGNKRRKRHDKSGSGAAVSQDRGQSNSKIEFVHVKEEDVGMTEYMCPDVPGFTATIKERFSDFLVHEITPEGEVVHLKSIEFEEPETTEPLSAEEQQKRFQADQDKVIQLVGSARWQELSTWAAALSAEMRDTSSSASSGLPQQSDRQSSDEAAMPRNDGANAGLSKNENMLMSATATPTELTLPCPADKSDRALIHKHIAQAFPGTFASATIERDADRVFQVKPSTGGSRKPRKKLPKPYVHFTLVKSNKDTMTAVFTLAQKLRVKPNIMCYAGTKDKRAVTAQRISIKDKHPDDLIAVSKRLIGFGIGDFSLHDEPLRLGQLSGNRFIITLRNCSGSDEEINKALESFKEHGFVNYFGLQRFGSTSVPTHAVGAALLREEYDKAIDLIMQVREGEKDQLTKARQFYADTKDAHAALKRFPASCAVERSLLRGLAKHGSNHVLALASIARSMRMMYVHALQSFIWNRAVSHRLRLSHKPMVGDLVLESDFVDPLPDGDEDTPAFAAADAGDDDDSDEAVADDDELRNVPKVKVIGEADVDKYTIFDIVLPIPGFAVQYPENEMKSVYEGLMAEEGLDLDNMKRSVKAFSLPGTYRRMCQKARDVTWHITKYDDVRNSLTLTDLDRLAGKQEPPIRTDGQYKAVIAAFSLPSSTYATMALREILKVPTDTKFQMTLNTATVDTGAAQATQNEEGQDKKGDARPE